MTLFNRLLLVTFIESGSTVFIERGIFFFTREKMQFTDEQNLWLALAFAAPYAVFALAAHRVTTRLDEKRVTIAAVAGQTLFLALVAAMPTTFTIFLAKAAMGAFTGLKWPPIESYVNAGLTPSQAAKRVGVFNLTWAGAVPLTVLLVGPLIAWWDRALFVLPALAALPTLWLLRRLASRPTHLPDDHPERPEAARLKRIAHLLGASRWLMLCAYGSYFVLAAVTPGIFDRAGVGVIAATSLSSLIEIMRVVMFGLLIAFTGWHEKAWPIVVTCVLLPLGFAGIVSEQSLAMVLVGECLFGFAMGISYYAALYYAMVVKNAAVDAGGVHEGLIGIGFVIGPLLGLAGHQIGVAIESRAAGTMLGVAPLLLLGAAMSLRSAIRAGKTAAATAQ